MMITTPGRNVPIATDLPVRRSMRCIVAVVSHDDVMGHGLDDVVQWLMFPVGDSGAGGVQSHVKWRGPEHARHLRIGRTPVGNRYVALARFRRGRQILRNIARIRLAHSGCSRWEGHALAPPGLTAGWREAVASGLPVIDAGKCRERSARVLGAVWFRRLSQSGCTFPDPAPRSPLRHFWAWIHRTSGKDD